MFAIGLNTGSLKMTPGLIANLGAQQNLTARQGLYRLGQHPFRLTTLVQTATVQVRLAVSDKPNALWRGFIEQKFPGMTKVFLDQTTTLAGHRHQYRPSGVVVLNTARRRWHSLNRAIVIINSVVLFQFLPNSRLYLHALLHSGLVIYFPIRQRVPTKFGTAVLS